MSSAARRKLMAGFELLESRRLMALASTDTFIASHWGDTYDRPSIVQQVQPVEPTQDLAGHWTYDFRTDTPWDQTVDLKQQKADDIPYRFLIDPSRSYEIGGLLSAQNESSVVVKALDANGVILDSLYMVLQGAEVGSSVDFEATSYPLVEGRAVMGSHGRPFPAGTVSIEFEAKLSPNLVRTFGFSSDETQRVQQATWNLLDEVVSNRSLDQRIADQQIPIEGSSAYVFEFGGSRVDGASSTQLHSAGITVLDTDHRVISGVHVERFLSAADTTLAADLKPGDTEFVLTDANGWSNRSNDPRTRSLAWYGYRNSRGELYPDYSYTRNVASDPIDGLWAPGAVQGNRITLTKPWTGPKIPAGTAIRNAVDSGTFFPVALERATLSASNSNDVQGYWQQGGRSLRAFPPGTAWATPTMILNQSEVATDENVRVQFRYWQKQTVWSQAVVASNSRTVMLDVLANDELGVRATTSIVSVTQPKFGSVSIVPGSNGVPDKVRYVGTSYFVGSDRFQYQIHDSVTGQDASAEVHVKFIGGNLEANAALQTRVMTNPSTRLYPGTVSSKFLMATGQTLDGNGTTNAKPLAIYDENVFGVLHDAPAFGSLQFNPDGTFQYQPDPGFVGTDTFTLLESNLSQRQLRMVSIVVAADEGALDALRLADIGAASLFFESVFKVLLYPRASVGNRQFDANFRPLVSWRVRMLPYLGFTSLYDRFKLDEPWDSANNLPLLAEMPDVFRSEGDSVNSTTTRYQVLASTLDTNPSPLFLNEKDHRLSKSMLREVTDGLDQTIAMVKSGVDKSVPWTKPDDLDFDMADPLKSLGNVGAFFDALFYHSSGQSVRQIPVSVGNAAFQSMASLSETTATFDVPTNARNWSTLPGARPVDGVFQDSGMQNSMRLVGLGLLNYESAFKRLAPIPNVPKDANGMPFLSWRVYILPYIGYASLYSQFKLDQGWDSPNNLPLQSLMPDVFRSVGDGFTSTTTRIHVLGGPGMAYQNYNTAKGGPRLNEFTDGMDSIVVVEAGVDKAVPWTKPGVLDVDPANVLGSLGMFPDGQMRYTTADLVVGKMPMSLPVDAIVSQMTISADSVRNPRSPYEVLGIDSFLGPLGKLSSLDANTIRQLGLGALNYESAFKRLPINHKNASGKQLLSWRVAILPYLGKTALYNSFHFDEPWDSPNNLALLPAMPQEFRSANDPSVTSFTRFQMFDGPGTINPSGTRTRLAEITDGWSNTAMIVRTGLDKAVPWTKPDDVDFTGVDVWESLGDIGSKTLFLRVDDSAVRLGPSLGDSFLAAFVTINGGEVLNTVTDSKSVLYIREGGLLDFVDSQATTITVDNPSLVSFGTDGKRLTVGTPNNIAIDGTRRTKIRLNGVPLDVIVFDDDSAEILPLYSSPVRVTELGDTADHWVRLNAPITSDVTIAATADDPTEIALTNTTLSFTPTNWNVPQRITVRGLPDGIADGDVASLIQWRVTASSDSAFPVGLRATSQAITLDNRPPTNLRLRNVLDTLREDVDTSSSILLAKVLFDDEFGNNQLGLSGPDALSFELVGNSLQLKAGAILDFETKPLLRVTVSVDDSTVGATPDQSIDFVLNVTDINEAPGLTLTNLVTSVPENNTTGIDVADVTIVDDALGTNTLSLSGPDAAMFEIAAGKLKLKPSVLDFETKPTLRVVVSVDDATVGTTPDHAIAVVLNVTDVNEAPGLTLTNLVTSVLESNTSGLNVADVTIKDDALGTNTLSLSGPDAGLFEIAAGKLKLKPSSLDFETKPTLQVTVSVDDSSVGTTPDQSIDVILNVTDVNEAPGLALTNVVTSVPESNTAGFDVANITINDDALGINTLGLSGPDASMFVISGSKLKLKPSSLDFETKPVLRVTVSVDDSMVGTTPDQSIDVVLNVTDVNEAPGLALTNVVTSVPESNTAGIDVADVTIKDDALGTNTLSLTGPDASMFVISGGKLKLKPSLLDFETKPTLRVTISVDDPAVGTTPDQSIDVVLNVTDANDAPGLTLTNVLASVPESNTSGLDVADVAIKDDARGTNTLSLSGPDLSMFVISGGKLKLRPSILDFETRQTLRVTVSVDDPTVGTTPDQSIDVVLNVTDVNEVPGLTLSNGVTAVPESNTSGLDVADVTIEDDALGSNALSLSGPDATMFEISGGKLKLKPSSLDFETKPVLRVTVSVDDPTVGTTPDQSIDVVLNVTDVNEAPGLTLTNIVASVPESNTSGLNIADVAIKDDALGSNTLSLSGPEASLFVISGGKLKLKPTSLDFETKSVLRVTVSVDDPAVGATPDQSIDVVLNVTDINEAPGIILTNMVTSVSESNTTGLNVADVTVKDDALGTNTLSLSGPDAAMFEVVAGKLKLKPSALDFETQPTLRVTVSVDDPTVGATPDQSVNVVLTVTDVNEAPSFTLANAVNSVVESNTTGLNVADITINDDALGTNTLSLSGPDAAMFEVVAGKLKLKPSALDFETKPTLQVTVSVDDPTVGAAPDQSVNVVLNVTDANEAPSFTLANVVTSVAESNTTGLNVADITVKDDALGTNTLGLSGPDAAMFEVVAGKLKLKQSVLDFETRPTLRVTVSVDDPTVGATPDQSVNVVLNVTDVNEAPSFTLANVMTSVAESNTTGLNVADITVKDDALGTNTLSLSGPDAAMFEVVSGKLKLKPSTLDFETKPTLRVTVSVDDPTVGATPDQSINVVLTVTDVNEAPSFTLANVVTSVAESNTTGLNVADITVKDDALGTNTLSLSGPDAAMFEVVAGKLKLKPSALDFETKPTLRVTVSIDDSSVGTTPDQSVDVVLNVTDVNESPTQVIFTDVLLRIPEEQTVPQSIKLASFVVVDDALGSNAVVLQGPDAAIFEIVDSKLWLKAGLSPNFEQRSSYSVRVAASDPLLTNSTPAFYDYVLSIDNRPEVTGVSVSAGGDWNQSVQQVRIAWDMQVNLSDTAITWTKEDIGGVVVPFETSVSTVNNKTVTDIRFVGKYVDAVGLLDGKYGLKVAGDQVVSASNPIQGIEYTESFIAIRPQPSVSIVITSPPLVGIGSPTSIDIQVSGLPQGANNVRYDIDLNGDKVPDRTIQGGASVSLQDWVFEHGGSNTVVVDVSSEGSFLGEGSTLVDVVPYTTRGSRWTSTLDVDSDNTISPLDVLNVINWLNDSNSNRRYQLNLDVDRDASISPLDVLTIINHINSNAGSAPPTPFESLIMNDTGASDGLTSDIGFHGMVKEAGSKLYVSLDGAPRKEIAGAIQSNKQFELTDRAISQLFGNALDGDHLLTVGTIGSDGVWRGMDRRFTRSTHKLQVPELKTALQQNGLYLQWISAGNGARYRVMQVNASLPATQLAGGISGLSTHIDLPAGNYQIYIEAYDQVGNKEVSQTIQVMITS